VEFIAAAKRKMGLGVLVPLPLACLVVYFLKVEEVCEKGQAKGAKKEEV
jgi:hypothetical protein